MEMEMVRADVNFIFHNVGQGLFYSGEIESNMGCFRFIYDCGSENKWLVKSSIKRFKNDTADKVIHLLILSHLDKDHTNGVDELFAHFDIREVIIPYFSPVERLIIALRRVNMPEWYYEFLADPVEYLFERGVERIIILGGKGGGERKEDFPPSNEIPLEWDEYLKINLPEDPALEKEIRGNEEDWESYIDEKRLLVRSHNGYILALGLWFFKFFNYKVSRSNLQNFRNCLNRKGVNPESGKDIKEVIRDEKHRKELRKDCYSPIVKELREINNTSLVAYHGPLGRVTSVIFLFSHHLPYHLCKIRYYDFNNNFGQFLTGDINLNPRPRYEELKNHYNCCLEKVVMGQVPHHGSKYNWREELLKDTPNSKIWVVSARSGSRHHPSSKVIESIRLNKRRCIWVNENNCLVITGYLIW